MAAAAGGAATANATPSSYIEAVTIDDMVYFAKNMLDKQQEFIQNNVSGYIGMYGPFLLAFLYLLYLICINILTNILFS